MCDNGQLVAPEVKLAVKRAVGSRIQLNALIAIVRPVVRGVGARRHLSRIFSVCKN